MDKPVFEIPLWKISRWETEAMISSHGLALGILGLLGKAGISASVPSVENDHLLAVLETAVVIDAGLRRND